jgi:hypothetical protein
MESRGEEPKESHDEIQEPEKNARRTKEPRRPGLPPEQPDVERSLGT